MKKIVIIFFVIICFACVKKGGQDSKSVDNNVVVSEEHVVYKEYTLQEQIENYDDKYIFWFQEEGNFTNSGYKEILAFYQYKSTYYNKQITGWDLNQLYCFLIDESSQKIVKVIPVKDYRTSEPEHDLDIMPMDTLGREVRWLNQRIGFIGDFNDNGVEELYFYEIYSLGLYPRFFEFQDDDFKDIFQFRSYTFDIYYNCMELVNVDTERKILTFEGEGREGKQGRASFIWNKEKQIYEKIENL